MFATLNERRLVAHVLSGGLAVSPVVLVPSMDRYLRPRDIEDPSLRALLVAAIALRATGVEPNDEQILRVVRALGQSAEGLEDELEELRREAALSSSGGST